MSAYIIAEVDITNPKQYEQYTKLSTLAMQKYHAQVCVRGGAVEVLEGDWQPKRMVVLRFPNMQGARQFYNSPEYCKAREVRAGAAVMRMVVVDGADEGENDSDLMDP